MKLQLPVRLVAIAIVHAVVLTVLSLTTFAQITTTGIRGIVRDPNGAVVPNATVKATDNATGVEQTTVTSSDGGFIFPALQFGSYKIAVTATGFQNSVIAAVVVESGRTTNISVDLNVGAATDTVQIAASAEQLNTTTAEVGSTINNKLVQNLPYAGRDSLNFAVLIAGSSRSTSDRNSTFNGLPNASLNITLDGMNNNSQRFKSGGTSFFAFAPARIDAIEEVSVSTTGLGADAGGEGAMQIRMTTRRGTEQYHGKILYQGINEALNANTFFRNMASLPRNKARQHNPVGAIGGPLVPFSKRLKNKLFFFAYYEAQPQPFTQTYSTPVLTTAAQQGNFTYLGTDGQERTVNLLDIARVAGHTGTVDPTMMGILGKINSSQSGASGFQAISGVSTKFMQNMLWDQALTTMQAFPTARVDFQIKPSVGWHGTWNLRHSDFTKGSVPYPGSPYDFVGPAGINSHSSATPYIATNAVDWTIRPNITNNANLGIQGTNEYFFIDADPKRFAEYNNRIINTPLVGLYIPNVNTDVRNNPVYQFTDNLNWVKGRHTLTMGGTWLHTTFYSHTWGTAGVPQYNFGVVTADPINNVLRNALTNVNTNNNDIANALNLYALLTGRITSVSVATNADEKTKEYRPFSESMQRYAFTTFGLYFQDSFRMRPSLTLNYGLRWQFDGDVHSGNDLLSQPSGSNFYGPSTGLFQPGVLSSNQNPQFEQVIHPYKRDYMNPAPNFGFAWNPAFENGWLGKVLGERKSVIRGAYSITFYNEGLNSISNSLSGGRGLTQTGTATNGVNFTPGSLELRSPAPAIPVFPAKFGFPIAQNSFSAPVPGNYINPELRSPYVQNWSLGIQRQLTKSTVLELRYVGNKSTHMWHRQNIQEVNIFENGFLNEFVQAKKNLDINIANGRGQTFANNNLAGQAALPILQAAFGALGNQAALTAAQGFGNATFIQNLNQGVAGTLAQSLATSPTNFCRLVGNKVASCVTAGFNVAGAYPINLFQANPYLSSLTYQDSNGDNNYNALQVDVKQQYSHGLLLGGNYVWSHALGDIQNETDQAAGYTWYTYRNARLNYGPSPFDRRHVFNAYWSYDLPFGKGRRFLSNNAWLDRAVGGWTIGGRETIASGDPVLLNGGRNTVNNLTQAGVVFGGGFTPEQLQKALSKVKGGFSSTALISDIASIATITQTATASTSVVNSSLYAPASTPGQYAGFVYLRNNNLYTFDMSINKEVRFTERWRLTLRLVALNFLNHPYFEIGNTSPTATTFGQITAPAAGTRNQGNRTMQFRASLDW
ncbi:MAG: carboxypeptidase regulatory-like domain-containing protein [Acidobacteria bacterium]|nr:carboxypeptidase regulatory-like domain-containing protein [Acidobacteriota bacterium]MBI3424832.1 carboxypeptidase regulatory-like domain-containing protein [Acidobacteriota bacterium]